jgi:hypothetical protein
VGKIPRQMVETMVVDHHFITIFHIFE